MHVLSVTNCKVPAKYGHDCTREPEQLMSCAAELDSPQLDPQNMHQLAGPALDHSPIC